MILRNSCYGKFWGCTGWPDCDCKHGAHPDGSPMGVPGNQEVRALRIEVHRICDEIWGKGKDCDKKAMYRWLKRNTSKGHISHMLKDELLETKRLLMIYKVRSTELYSFVCFRDGHCDHYESCRLVKSSK